MSAAHGLAAHEHHVLALGGPAGGGLAVERDAARCDPQPGGYGMGKHFDRLRVREGGLVNAIQIDLLQHGRVPPSCR